MSALAQLLGAKGRRPEGTAEKPRSFIWGGVTYTPVRPGHLNRARCPPGDDFAGLGIHIPLLQLVSGLPIDAIETDRGSTARVNTDRFCICGGLVQSR